MKASILVKKATLVLSIIGVFASCKKSDKPNKPSCRIITATASGGDAYNFTYNTDGTLSTITTTDMITSFQYSGNTVIETTTDGGVFQQKRIVTNNADGLATNVRLEYNTSATDWGNDAIEYSGTEIIKSTHTTSSGGTPAVSTYTWSGGNLKSIVNGSYVTSLDYFSDKPAQDGDYIKLLEMTEGYSVYRNKNLLKSVLSGSSITSFTYNFDGDGKILSFIGTDGSSNTTYTFQYQCN